MKLAKRCYYWELKEAEIVSSFCLAVPLLCDALKPLELQGERSFASKNSILTSLGLASVMALEVNKDMIDDANDDEDNNDDVFWAQ
eukprot:2873592-Amphidinium_carterae.1